MAEKVIVSDWTLRGEFDNETIAGWAREIRSYEEIPKAFTGVITDTKPFPYTIYVPEERGFFGVKSPVTILQLFDSSLVSVTKQNNTAVKKVINFADILYMESGNSLLRSWADFISLNTTINLSFNQANFKVIKPIIDTIRKSYRTSPADPEKKDNFASFEFLLHKNHKMMNYGALSVFPEDTICARIYQQSEILAAIILFNRKFYQKKTKPFIIIFTKDEVIRFCDHLDEKSENLSTIGGIYTYFPRSKITNISGIKNEMQNYYDLNIQLTPSYTITSRFYLNNIELSAFLSEIKSTTI